MCRKSQRRELREEKAQAVDMDILRWSRGTFWSGVSFSSRIELTNLQIHASGVTLWLDCLLLPQRPYTLQRRTQMEPASLYLSKARSM